MVYGIQVLLGMCRVAENSPHNSKRRSRKLTWVRGTVHQENCNAVGEHAGSWRLQRASQAIYRNSKAEGRPGATSYHQAPSKLLGSVKWIPAVSFCEHE